MYTNTHICVCANSLHSCLTHCDPMDHSPPGSPVHGDSPGMNTGMGCYALLSAVKSLQSCPTLCDPIDGSPPDSPVPGILQARTLEWVAISFSNAWKGKVKVKSLSRVWLFVTPWTAACQAPPSMGFSRQALLSHVYKNIYICTCIYIHKLEMEMATHSSILAWRIP